MRSIQYQESLAEYFAQLLVNFEAREGVAENSILEFGDVSVATHFIRGLLRIFDQSGNQPGG